MIRHILSQFISILYLIDFFYAQGCVVVVYGKEPYFKHMCCKIFNTSILWHIPPSIYIFIISINNTINTCCIGYEMLSAEYWCSVKMQTRWLSVQILVVQEHIFYSLFKWWMNDQYLWWVYIQYVHSVYHYGHNSIFNVIYSLVFKIWGYDNCYGIQRHILNQFSKLLSYTYTLSW